MKWHIPLLILGYIAFWSVAQDSCGRKPQQPPWEPEYNWGTDPHIVGGRNATPGYWPWQLSLQFLRENTTSDFRHTCGAVLIDPLWALTAAHCVTGNMIGMNDSRREDPANFRLLVGAHDQQDLSGVYTHGIDLIVKHERWAADPTVGYPNDIALLRLIEPADTSTENIDLACVPLETDFDFTGEECWISGWGLVNWQAETIPRFLQEAQIDAISVEECKGLNFGYIRESHICAGRGYPNACSGDSGGPMSCFKDGQWYAAGLASWTIVFCEGIPAVYTRVSSFWEWIVLVMAGNPHP